MTWILAMVLALLAFGAMAFVFKTPRGGWSVVAFALVVGLVGYGLQASPGVPGSPRKSAERIVDNPALIVESRNRLSESGIPPSNQWLIIADGLARNGQFANAAEVLLGAVEEDPDNSEAWLALANSLVAHADGLLTPASQYAYRKAQEAAPESPGPPFFLGMALAQSGRFMEARNLWVALLDRAKPDAPWRNDLKGRLERLDMLIAAQARTGTRE